MDLSKQTGVEPTNSEVNALVLVASCLAVIGAISLWMGVPTLFDTLGHTWTPVEGNIEAVGPIENDARKAKVYYQYAVDGHTYTGAFVTDRRKTGESDRVAEFAPGSPLELYHAMEAPSLSRLDSEPTSNEWLTPMIGGLCTLFAPLVFWKRRQFAAWLIDLEERLLGPGY
jgi:hypothetical protein